MSFVWNYGHTGIINLDKVRNFELTHDKYGVEVVAWISDGESIHVGRFNSEKNAITFLEGIAYPKEGKNEK